MNINNDGLMVLPEKEYYRLREVAAKLSIKSNREVLDEDVIYHIGQGRLPAYIHSGKEYYLVPESELNIFADHVRDKTTRKIIFPAASFVPERPNLFDEMIYAPPDLRVNRDDVYIKAKDLSEFITNSTKEAQETNQKDKKSTILPENNLGATERKKLLLIIAALVDLAGSYNEPVNTTASDIMQKVNVSQNTIVKHLRAAFEERKKEEKKAP